MKVLWKELRNGTKIRRGLLLGMRVLAEYLGFWKAGMQDHGRELQGSGGGMLAHGCVNSLLFDPVVPEASSLPNFLFSTTVSNHIFYPSEMLLFHKINLTSNDSPSRIFMNNYLNNHQHWLYQQPQDNRSNSVTANLLTWKQHLTSAWFGYG